MRIALESVLAGVVGGFIFVAVYWALVWFGEWRRKREHQQQRERFYRAR